jgi:hypothetical protein
MSILTQALLALVCRNLMALTLTAARHYTYLLINLLASGHSR